MNRKILGIFVVTLFIISVLSGISTGINDHKMNLGEEIMFTSFDGPNVVITSPDDGAEVTDLYIVVEGYAASEIYMTYWEWLWESEDGSQTGGEEIEPVGYYEFSIDIGPLTVGKNTITVAFYDVEENSGSDSATVYYVSWDSDPPEVVITSPDEGAEFDEPDIEVEGYADDHNGSGIKIINWTHKWVDGLVSGEEEYDEPEQVRIFIIPLTLHEGVNTIEVTAEDFKGNKPDEPSVIHVSYKPKEGLLIDSVFQPVQTVYPDDPLYAKDIKDGPCWWNCELDMVAGKNTYLFGYPYNDRNSIKITVHNNYTIDKTFSFVFKIYPDNEVIWRSEPVTVKAGEKKTFTYNAPLPEQPFRWEHWGDNPKVEDGEVVLYLDPDPPVKPPADCRCEVVTLKLKIKYTHDLDVLFIPFTFSDGPAFPVDLATPLKFTNFDRWRLNDLEPWWQAIYPLRENGFDTDYFCHIKKDFTIDGIKVNNLTQLGTLTSAQLARLQDEMLRSVLALSWIGNSNPPLGVGGWDRIVLLVHPNVLSKTGNVNGLAYLIPAAGAGAGAMKQGVWVNWDTRTKTAAHEVSHTYGLDESYKPPGTPYKAVGYWVNKKEDVVNSEDNKDLMWRTYPIWEAVKKSWIKKPNFKILLNIFNAQRDPEVLCVSGFIDKNDSVELNPWYALMSGNVDIEWDSTGNYLLRAYDSYGELLNETGFNVSFTRSVDDLGHMEFDEASFAFRVEWMNDLHKIEIVNATSGEILTMRTVTPNPPQISITSPKPGETIKLEPYEITWDSYDSDGDILTYNILMNNVSEDIWFPISASLQENSFVADFTYLPKGDYQLKVFATDGWNIGEDIVNFEAGKGKEKNAALNQLFFEQLFACFPFLKQFFSLFPFFEEPIHPR